MRPHIGLPAKAAAEEMRHHGNLLERHAEYDRYQLPGAEYVLSSLVKRQRAARVPDRHRCVRFHLVVVAIRCGIGLLDPESAFANSFLRVPTDDATGQRNCGGSTASFAVPRPKMTAGLTSYSTQPGRGVHRLIARRRDHQSHRLARIVNLVVLEGKIALAVWMRWLHGFGVGFMRGILRWVKTANTPGASRPPRFDRYFRPFAIVLWAMAACAASASGISAV